MYIYMYVCMYVYNYNILTVYNILVGGWATPLKNMSESQLGWWHSQLNGKYKYRFQTTKQMM